VSPLSSGSDPKFAWPSCETRISLRAGKNPFQSAGLGDGSSDDGRIVRPEAADRLQDEWRSTPPDSGTIWLLSRPSLQLLKPSRSGCQTGGDDAGG
jgi:hypothetical protein